MLLKRFSFLLRPSGQIEIFRGIRALVVISVPIVTGNIIGQPKLGLIAGFCAQILLLADTGGLYSLRSKTLIGTTLGIALALIVGTLVSAWLGLTILVIFCGLFLAGYLTVYGENGAAAGLVIGIVILLAITLPGGGIALAIGRALIALLAGVWVIVLALWFWPFQPNQPLRQVVARNFQGIAQYLRDLQMNPEKAESSLSQVRQLLLKSRNTLAYTRMGLWGKNELREWLIVLIEDSDRIVTSLIAMRELINLHPLPQMRTVEILLEDVLEQVALITEDIAQLILGKRKMPDCNRLKLLIDAIEQQYLLQRKVVETDIDNYKSYVAIGQLKTRLKKLQQQLQLATQTAQQLQNRESWPTIKAQLKRSPTEGELWTAPPKFWWEPLQENFTLDSPIFRHAFRLGLGSAIGVLIYTFAQIPHGFWIGLTLIIVLKPDFSLTFQRFFYRMIGTILGAVAVTLLLTFIHDSFWLHCIGFLSISIALSLIRFHYSLAVFFITLFVLIFSQLYPESPNVNFIQSRLICTLIGAILAFALSFSLGRPQEELLFSKAVVKAIEETNHYFQSVMAVYLGVDSYHPNQLIEMRHKTRLANVNLDAALQRLINDPNTPFKTIEPAITLGNYIPRLGRGVTVLVTQLENYSGSQPHPKVALFTEQVIQALTELTVSLQEKIPILPLPPFDETVDDILSHLQQLQEERLMEIAKHQEGTRLQSYLRDYNVVVNDFLEIIRRIEAIHTSIRRFQEPYSYSQL